MFAGNKRRSSNVRVMQLFHELKQQFPTIPDHVVTSCITSYIQSNSQEKSIVKLLETTLAESNLAQMGRSSNQLETPPSDLTPTAEVEHIPVEENLTADKSDMNESVSGERDATTPSPINTSPEEIPPRTSAKRPNYLDIKQTIGDKRSEVKKTFDIQLSEKCKDVYKLLNSDLSEKPPRSPLSAKRFAAKNSPTKADKGSPDPHRRSNNPDISKKELCSTPSQTTDTLLGNSNLGLSLNVNCSVDIQSPTQPRLTSTLQVTPTQPWLQPQTSPRSFTSVNLTLRPPASTPQDPIDITSQNSSLTYSTSSYDSQKGLQSRLQITVGPGNGSVASLRVRPRSYHPPEAPAQQEMIPLRAESVGNLAVSSESPVRLQQQARIDKLRIELKTEKARLVIMKQEIEELEKSRLEDEVNIDLEKQLIREIKHLTYQCKVLEQDSETFYNNIYTGQVINEFPTPPPRLRTQNRRTQRHIPASRDFEGPKWNCPVCTFLNHPILQNCEQCDYPGILHGTKTEAVNSNITFQNLRLLNNIDVGRATRSLSLNNVPQGQVTRPIGFIYNSAEHAAGVPEHINTSRSVPNMVQNISTKKD